MGRSPPFPFETFVDLMMMEEDRGTHLPQGLLEMFARLFQVLPHNQAMALGRTLGSTIRILGKKKALLARSNLEQAYPELGGTENLDQLLLAIYRHFGQVGAEFLRFPVMKEEWLKEHVRVSGLDHVFSLLKEGKGILAFSAHFGNWELAIKRLSLEIPEKIHVVIRRIKDPAVHEFIRDYRERFGGAVSILQDRGAGPMIRILKKNGIVVTVLDQNAGVDEGVFTPYFGRPAATYTSVARLSYKLEIPLLPVFDARISRTDHHVQLGPPMVVPDLPEEEAVKQLTNQCTAKIESMVRQYPEQWIWMHNRWKTRPPEVRDHREA